MAHTALAIAEPKYAAVVMEAPEQLDLTFTQSVRLLKVAMKMCETDLDVGFTPFAAASEVLAISLSELKSRSYEVNWTVMGDDSHQVQGKLSFAVGMHSNHASREGTSQETHESHSTSNHSH